MAADHHPEHARNQLSDNVIGIVFQRDQRSSQYKANQFAPPKQTHAKPDDNVLRIAAALHRERNRRCQARFRVKQRKREQDLEQCVHHLWQEVQSLKIKHSARKVPGKTKPSSWVIVGQLFQSFESCFQAPCQLDELASDADTPIGFLQTVVTPSMDQEFGFDALMDQLKRFALYFEDSQPQLERIDAAGPSVMKARATLSVTISDFTLKSLFPTDSITVRTRLLGKRLDCRWCLTFLLEESGCVERLESSIDLLSPLMQMLGVEDSIRILSQALE